MREAGVVMAARGKQDWGDWDRRGGGRGMAVGKTVVLIQGESAAAGEGERREAKVVGG
jgi:hypothetical protein